MNEPLSLHPVYIFLDEGGNFDFSQKGTKYFTITSVLKTRPFKTFSDLTSLRYDLIESGLDIEHFHASEDRQAVRDRVFEILGNDLDRFMVDSVIAEKRKTGPALQERSEFYSRMLGYLLRYVIERIDFKTVSKIIVITDSLPIAKRRVSFEKTVKKTLKSMLPKNIPYVIMHHNSKSASGLQMADYFNWAIFRKWERGDSRSFDIIKDAVRSEFEIFRTGEKNYY